jgi:hypothetical protein
MLDAVEFVRAGLDCQGFAPGDSGLFQLALLGLQ